MIKLAKFFWEADGVESGASASDDSLANLIPVPDDNVGDVSDSGQQDAVPEPPAVIPEPSAHIPSFDAAALGKSLADSLISAGVVSKPAPQQQPMSPEEAKKLLNIWEPDDAWYAKYDNLDTRKEAIKEQRDALIKQADTIAQIRMQQIQQNLENKYNPIVEAMQRQEAEARETRFNTTYKELANPAMKPVIAAVAGELVRAGKKFANESEMFNAIAQGTAAVIRSQNPNFKLSTPVSAGGGKKSSSIPVTSPGGGGGGKQSTVSNAPTKRGSRVLQILGDVG